MSLHLCRVVLKSGSVTELLFDRADDARRATIDLTNGAIVTDDYGHEFSADAPEIAALIYVDLDAEIRGHTTMTFARQMAQDRLAERVQKTRELAAPPVIQQRPNGTPILVRP
jgi:hypothetical protein